MNSTETNVAAAQLIGVTKTFRMDGNATNAVHNISVDAHFGELLLLLGPSGSGKTTLLTLLAGFLEPTTGVVRLSGKNLRELSLQELQKLRAEKMGFVFQTFHLIDALTVVENITLVLRFAGRRVDDARRRALEQLSELRIEHLASKFPPRLSHGEKQRVAVARAVANNADLILADEPTSSLESTQGFEIIQLLHKYAREENKCVIVASHDLRLLDFADRVIRLEDGCIIQRTAE